MYSGGKDITILDGDETGEIKLHIPGGVNPRRPAFFFNPPASFPNGIHVTIDWASGIGLYIGWIN